MRDAQGKEYIQTLQEKLKTAGDVSVALEENYQSLELLQKQMLHDIKEKSFPMEAYLKYFEHDQVANGFKALKKEKRKEHLLMISYFAFILVGTFFLFPTVAWGMLVALAGFLLFKRYDDLQRENYRNLCCIEVERLSEECEVTKEKIAYYKGLEDSIQKAINKILSSSMFTMTKDRSFEQADAVVQEYAPKLVFTYPKEK